MRTSQVIFFIVWHEMGMLRVRVKLEGILKQNPRFEVIISPTLWRKKKKRLSFMSTSKFKAKSLILTFYFDLVYLLRGLVPLTTETLANTCKATRALAY